MVDPERNPRQHNNEYTRQVRLEHEVANIPAQFETQRQPLVDACRQLFLEFHNFSSLYVMWLHLPEFRVERLRVTWRNNMLVIIINNMRMCICYYLSMISGVCGKSCIAKLFCHLFLYYVFYLSTGKEEISYLIYS